MLMTEFDRLKIDDKDTVDDFTEKISCISSKAASFGENIEESKMVKTFLNGLLRHKYIQIVPSLEQVLDLNSTSFEDSCKAYSVWGACRRRNAERRPREAHVLE